LLATFDYIQQYSNSKKGIKLCNRDKYGDESKAKLRASLKIYLFLSFGEELKVRSN